MLSSLRASRLFPLVPLMLGFAIVAAAHASRLAAQQLSPDTQVDRLIVVMERQVAAGDYNAALATTEEILQLQRRYRDALQIPEVFWYRRAWIATEAKSVDIARESANRYLQMAGSQGEHYREVLELLADIDEMEAAEEARQRQAEARQRQAEARQRQAAAERAEAQRQRTRSQAISAAEGARSRALAKMRSGNKTMVYGLLLGAALAGAAYGLEAAGEWPEDLGVEHGTVMAAGAGVGAVIVIVGAARRISGGSDLGEAEDRIRQLRSQVDLGLLIGPKGGLGVAVAWRH